MKYMDDYNYHDWAKFMVTRPDQRPVGAHFAAVMFETRQEYDRDDTGSSYTVPAIVYFAFPDQETLSEWTLRAMKDKKKFFFFKVEKLGNAELKVDVDVEI